MMVKLPTKIAAKVKTLTDNDVWLQVKQEKYHQKCMKTLFCYKLGSIR